MQCSRCRNQVDETTRKTCPTCLTPLPTAASPSLGAHPVPAAPSASVSSAIPIAAPKSAAPPPMYPGTQPAPSYAPPAPQAIPPASGYAPPLYGNGYAPQPGAGLPPYPGSAPIQGNGYVPAGYPGSPQTNARPADKPSKSRANFDSTSIPWWRVLFIVSAIIRAVSWGVRSNQTHTTTYTPPMHNYATPASGGGYMPSYTPPSVSPVIPSYSSPGPYSAPSGFSGGPSSFGSSHFSPPPMPQSHFTPPAMPTPHFGAGSHFGR